MRCGDGDRGAIPHRVGPPSRRAILSRLPSEKAIRFGAVGIAVNLLALAASSCRADAADVPVAMPVKAPPAATAFSWTGGYFGGNFGWGVSGLGVAISQVPGEALQVPAFQSAGMLAGLQLGYNYQLENGVVVGLEGDATFADLFGKRMVMRASAGQSSQFVGNLRNFGTARGRVGYAFGNVLPYVTGGLAWGSNRVENDFNDGSVSVKSLMQVGWTVGAGIEYAIGGRWTAKAEYNYIDFGAKTYRGLFFDEAALASGTFDPNIHVFKLGLNYRLQNVEAGGANADADDETDLSGWSIHGQSTFIAQGYPSFRSVIPDGPNSLSSARQARETLTATAFVGRKLWDGAEFYFDPEIDQGFGLSDTLGVAAFPNGEAQKSNFPVPRPNAARLFLRQTIGLGGEQETVEDGQNQIAGQRDISRLTFTVGKFAITDLFNSHLYASDSRVHFLNWNLWGTGSYDVAGDQVGLTWGAVAELNQKDWAVRAGYFLVPVISNVNQFDNVTRGQYVTEFEKRYTLFGEPGKLRLLGWFTHANLGSYTDALAEPVATPNFPDITLTRRPRDNFGVLVNIEQRITEDLGMLSRITWNPGKVEVLAWTETDESFSIGTVLKGTHWGRPDDRVGVAGVIEGLSKDARAYFEAGGIGVLIGDGSLNYRPERVLETYYAIALTKWATLTLDWQYVVNPAYNADRGPVSIFSTRMHVEY